MRSLTKAYLFGTPGKGNNYYVRPKFRILPITRLKIPASSNIWLITAAGLYQSAGISWSNEAESYFKSLSNKMVTAEYDDEDNYASSAMVDMRKNIKRFFTDSPRNSLLGTVEASRVYKNIRLEDLVNKLRSFNAVAATFNVYDKFKKETIDCFVTMVPRVTVYIAGDSKAEYNHLPFKIGSIVYYRLKSDVLGLKSSVWLIQDALLNTEHAVSFDEYDGYVCSVCKSTRKCPAIDYIKVLVKNGLPPDEYELPYQYWDSKLINKIKPDFTYGEVKEPEPTKAEIKAARSNLPDSIALAEIKEKTSLEFWKRASKSQPLIMDTGWKEIKEANDWNFVKQLQEILSKYDHDKSYTRDKVKLMQTLWEDLLDLYGGREHLNKQVKKLLDNSSIYIAMPLRVLADILENGIQYKSSVAAPELANQESGTIKERQEAEQYLFNVDPKKPEQAPKYGFFATKDYLLPNNIFRYGQVIIELKDIVKERAGISCGDTIDLRSNLSDPVVPCGNVDIDLFKRILMGSGASTYIDFRSIFKALRYIRNPTEGGRYGLDTWKMPTQMRLYYYEAHIFGTVTKDDIKSIYAGLKSDAKAISAIIQRSGLDISIKKYRVESAIAFPETTNIDNDDLIIERKIHDDMEKISMFDDIDIPLRDRNK